MSRFIFPEWTETLKKWVNLLVLGAPVYLVALIAYGVTPEALRIGYQPEQPVPYSHALHAGELGIDCRYCHSVVERPKRDLPGGNEFAIGPDYARAAAPVYFNWRKASIYGGSNEIQRNIIAKMVLGL